MVEQKNMVPETDDEPCVPPTADTLEGLETVDDDVSIRAAVYSDGKDGTAGKRGRKEGRRYGREIRRELMPYLLALLVLLGLTQGIAGLLWGRQQRRQADLYQIYGAGYEQE